MQEQENALQYAVRFLDGDRNDKRARTEFIDFVTSLILKSHLFIHTNHPQFQERAQEAHECMTISKTILQACDQIDKKLANEINCHLMRDPWFVPDVNKLDRKECEDHLRRVSTFSHVLSAAADSRDWWSLGDATNGITYFVAKKQVFAVALSFIIAKITRQKDKYTIIWDENFDRSRLVDLEPLTDVDYFDAFALQSKFTADSLTLTKMLSWVAVFTHSDFFSPIQVVDTQNVSLFKKVDLNPDQSIIPAQIRDTINTTPEMATDHHQCNGCHKIGNFKRCSKCKKTYYCSLLCQKLDWEAHKQVCVKNDS